MRRSLFLTVLLLVGLANSCPTFWTEYQGNCYRLFGEQVTWDVANSRCRDIGSELVSVHSAGEHAFVVAFWKSALSPTSSSFSLWLGLGDHVQEGTFVFTDGSPPDYTNWGANSPSNSYGNEDCVHFHDFPGGVNQWNDIDCTRTFAYMCKITRPCSERCC